MKEIKYYCQFHKSTGNHYSSQCSRNPANLRNSRNAEEDNRRQSSSSNKIFPMIHCRLLHHLSPRPSQIPTCHLPPDARRSIHVEIIFSFNLTFLTHSKNDNWQTKWFSIFDLSCQDNHRLKAQKHHRSRSTPEYITLTINICSADNTSCF